jgi:5-formyltetrahydrofolate cyclo-ligase
MTKEKIDRINALARKQKSEGLTEEERAEQAALRREYIDSFKRSLEGQLNNMSIVEPDGTIKKVEKKWKS